MGAKRHDSPQPYTTEIYSHGYYKILLPVSPPHIHLRIYAALLLSLGSLSCPSSSSSLSQSLISLLCSALFFSVRSQLQATSCFSISASHSIGFERLLRKMNGCYARMRATGSSTHKSRSVDYSDLLPFSSELENPRTEHGTGESRETARIRGNSGQNAELGDSGLLGWSPRRGKPELPLGGESFRVALRRSCSVASKRLGSRLERQSMGAQCSAVKRAFSMRRSSSVSERYCRIHDQSVTQMDHEEEEEDEGLDMTGSVKKIKNKKRGGKIFKACKRFLGL